MDITPFVCKPSPSPAGTQATPRRTRRDDVGKAEFVRLSGRRLRRSGVDIQFGCIQYGVPTPDAGLLQVVDRRSSNLRVHIWELDEAPLSSEFANRPRRVEPANGPSSSSYY